MIFLWHKLTPLTLLASQSSIHSPRNVFLPVSVVVVEQPFPVMSPAQKLIDVDVKSLNTAALPGKS